MRKTGVKTIDRLLAILLSVLMLLAVFPLGNPKVSAETTKYPDSYTVVVTDDTSTVNDALVRITNDEYGLRLDNYTDADGVAAFNKSEFEKVLADNGITSLLVTITVAKENHESFSQDITIDASNINGNFDAYIKKFSYDDEALISVNVTGNAAVEINNIQQTSANVYIGDKVPVKITPESGYYIRELLVNGEAIQVQKGSAYETTLDIVSDVTINAVVAEEKHTITVEKTEGGYVSINNEQVDSSVLVDDNTYAAVSVTADKNYQISAVTVNGVQQTISDKTNYVNDILIESDTVINVTFIKVYTVTVTYNENGTIETQPDAAGGKITVVDGDTVTITADPDDNYRVSQVVINGVKDETVTGENYGSQDVYTKILDKNNAVDGQIKVDITFAPNVYNINAESSENGNIVMDSPSVNYGESCSVKVIPNAGYSVSNIKVDEKEIAEYQLNSDGSVSFTILNITENKNIKAEYVNTETSKAPLETLFNSNEAVKVSGMKYIFGKNAQVIFEAGENSAVRLYNENGNLINYGDAEKTVTLSESTVISKIQLLYKAEGELGENWHDVEGVSANNVLRIVIDNVPTVSKVTPNGTGGVDFYNDSFSVNISSEDTDEYSGIASVEYFVTDTEIGEEVAYNEVPDDIKTQTGTLLTNTGTETQNYQGSVLVEVDENKNNSDFVKVWFKIVDLAGNEEYVRTENFIVNCTAPVLKSVSITGTVSDGADEGFYNCDRVATITIIDRESTFDVSKAYAGINIERDDGKGQTSGIPVSKIIWNHNGDEHTATITFDEEGSYNWSIGYTNNAGKELVKDDSTVEIGDDIYSFVIDKTAPKGEISYNVASKTWNSILETLTFGIWSNNEITATVKVIYTDEPSYSKDIKVLYYKSNSEQIMSAEELENIYKNEQNAFTEQPVTVNENEKFMVYARLSDKAGNTSYISTDGAIYDEYSGLVEVNPVDQPASNGFYNKSGGDSVKVKVDVLEKIDGVPVYSGISKIEYKVLNDEVVTDQGTLYTFDTENPSYEDLRAEWHSDDADGEYIYVNKEENNSDHVKVIVNVTDNAGNEYSGSCELSINIDEVKASMEIDQTSKNIVDGRGYYSVEQRKAVIKINERASAFDENGLTINVKALNYDGHSIQSEKPYEMKVSSSGDEHTIVIIFADDANYEWSFEYTNKAGNSLDTESNLTVNGDTPFKFTIDDVAPYGEVTINENTWNKILDVITFGLYSKTSADISIASSDQTSPVTKEYYISNKTEAMNAEELTALADGEFTKYVDKFSIDEDNKFVVYARITDYAGNRQFVSSDGYIVDKTPCDITITPSEANGFYDKNTNDGGLYGLYGSDSDLTVDIHVEDPGKYSGIQFVEYWIENNGEETQRQVLYNSHYERDEGINSNGGKLVVSEWFPDGVKEEVKEGNVPQHMDLKNVLDKTITVDKEANNSCDVVLYVRAIDNAGFEFERSVNLDIDITAPEIEVSFDNNTDNNGNTYFNDVRNATIKITEIGHHFNAQKATDGIKIQAVDVNQNTVDDAYTIDEWIPVVDKNEHGLVTYQTTVHFEKDANYTWYISYTDEAGNTTGDENNTGIETGDSVAPFKFTVDTTDPTGEITSKSSEGRTETWTELRKDTITYGFWSKESITTTATAADETSPIASVGYYKYKSELPSDGTEAITEEELKLLDSWQPLGEEGITVSSDEQFVVYLKIVDFAGNEEYISTNGLIVDHTAPIEETVAPVITINPPQPVNGIYNNDVGVNIGVYDPENGGTYSGLKEVGYKVYNMGEMSQTEILYEFNIDDPEQGQLKQSLSDYFTVNSNLNNSNDVEIVVYALDNALNYSEKSVDIKIDITDPTIDITYDNNTADNGKYFNENRTATIVVTERNFDPNSVNVRITNTDGYIPAVNGWSKTNGTGNMDDTTWTATILYNQDGDYTFDIDCADLAGNQSGEPDYNGSTAPTEFTVDKTLPVITVSYDNNSAQNEKYFAEARTATVTIVEHNFDVNRVEFTQTASLNGEAISIPSPSWSSSGDTHTATFVYSADGDYTFDVTATDMAANKSEEANYGGSVAGKDFVIDQTIEKPEITGIENGGAYKEDVVPSISFSDINYDHYEIKLLRTRLGEKNADVTAEFMSGLSETAQGGSGTFDTFEKIVENDGIYILTVTMYDKAGNEETEEITFSLNRFGSVYEYSDYLISLIKDGGQYITITEGNDAAVTEDLIITEYNPDQLLEDSLNILITRDGEAIDAEYTSNPVVDSNAQIGESGWYQYQYSIKASNFAEDGVYRITLNSKYATTDSESNESTSVPENSVDVNGEQVVDTMNFTVDTTAPEIRNILNLEKEIVNAENLDVRYTIVDVGGLKSVDVILNGETIDTVTDFGDSVFNYSGNFTIHESSNAQTVQLKVTDLAGNITDTAADDFDTHGLYIFNSTITVSTNFFVRWYANKPLFWGSIIGMVVILGFAGFIVVYKRKKKEEAEE